MISRADLADKFSRKWRSFRHRVSVYVAHRQHPIWTRQERLRLLVHIGREMSCKEPVLTRWFVTPRGNLILKMCSREDGAQYYAKTHLIDNDRSEIQRNFDALRSLSALPPPTDVAVPAPVALFEHRVGGRTLLVSVETGLPGVNAYEAPSLLIAANLAAATGAWERMTSAWSSPRGQDDPIIEERIADACRRLAERGVGGVPRRALHEALRSLRETDWPRHVGPEHGDFVLGNILLQSGAGASVLDWSELKPRGVPELDLVHLTFYAEAQRNGAPLIEEWAASLEARGPAALAARYPDARQLSAIAAVYWIHFLDRSLGHVDASWRRRHVEPGFDLIRRHWEPA